MFRDMSLALTLLWIFFASLRCRNTATTTWLRIAVRKYPVLIHDRGHSSPRGTIAAVHYKIGGYLRGITKNLTLAPSEKKILKYLESSWTVREIVVILIIL